MISRDPILFHPFARGNRHLTLLPVPPTEVIVGVNKYRLEKEDPLEVLMIDNQQVHAAQCQKLARIRAERDPETVNQALTAVTEAARTGEGNLLQMAVSRGEGVVYLL